MRTETVLRSRRRSTVAIVLAALLGVGVAADLATRAAWAAGEDAPGAAIVPL